MNTKFLKRLYQICETESLTEVARKTGVPYNTLKNYTNQGGRMPSSEVLTQIASSTGANINWLLLGQGEPLYVPKEEGNANVSTQLSKFVDIEIPAFRIKIRLSEEGKPVEYTEDIPLYSTAPAKKSDSIDHKIKKRGRKPKEG